MDDYMVSIFIVCCIIAAVLFVYEGMIAPSLRIKLRYELFDVRDRLIKLRHEHKQSFKHAEFDLMMYIVNASIFVLSHHNIIDVIGLRAKAVQGKAEGLEVEEQGKRIAATVEQSELPELKELHGEIITVTIQALAVNSLPFIVMLLPILGIIFIAAAIGQVLSRRVKNFRVYVQRLLILSAELRNRRDDYSEMAY